MTNLNGFKLNNGNFRPACTVSGASLVYLTSRNEPMCNECADVYDDEVIHVTSTGNMDGDITCDRCDETI